MRHELNTTLQLDYGRLDTETKAWDLLQYEVTSETVSVIISRHVN